MEGREAHGSGERTAIVAAASVRRLGLRVLRGEEVHLPPDAEQRIASLSADNPVSGTLRGPRFRRRSRPEALRRRAPGTTAPVEEPRVEPPPAKRVELSEADESPPTRRRRGRRAEDPVAPKGASGTGDSGPLRIVADTVQIITRRRADGESELVEVVADRKPPKDVPRPAEDAPRRDPAARAVVAPATTRQLRPSRRFRRASPPRPRRPRRASAP
jgi:hypothetical protein